jgi:acetyl-CoA carboxylase, biotin carboxylase subunit
VSLRKDSPVDRPFRRVLIANRGEIALRIIRACHAVGCEAVAVYSDADAGSRHVRAADVAVNIGPAPATQSYLRVAAIVDAARQTGAEAVHPGYGFLSEQPALAEVCAAAGIVFVGPAPATLAGLGDKLAARRTAAAIDVPTVPGMFEPLRLDGTGWEKALADAARLVAFPLLVKAAAGGGGRGMRQVDEASELAAAAVSASREAEASFGDGSVYLERLVEDARHVEVQLLGDLSGSIVALGERDCSVQRRHQKLVEEAPAPGLSPARRAELHELAVRMAAAVGLRNAATAEFLLAPTGEFWFLEVNARLQVEHGITELVSGVDIVAEQLWIAAGRTLSPSVRDAAANATNPGRHALEVRISAEDPARDFAPTPGRIDRWREPSGEGIRVDSGVEHGSVVSQHYDPLLAKLMTVAADRPAALALMRAALATFEISGVQTTTPFHRWLLDAPEFANASGLSTELVARTWRPAPIVQGYALRAAEIAVAAAARGLGQAPVSAEPAAMAWWAAGIADELDGRL